MLTIFDNSHVLLVKFEALHPSTYIFLQNRVVKLIGSMRKLSVLLCVQTQLTAVVYLYLDVFYVNVTCFN